MFLIVGWVVSCHRAWCEHGFSWPNHGPVSCRCLALPSRTVNKNVLMILTLELGNCHLLAAVCWVLAFGAQLPMAHLLTGRSFCLLRFRCRPVWPHQLHPARHHCQGAGVGSSCVLRLWQFGKRCASWEFENHWQATWMIWDDSMKKLWTWRSWRWTVQGCRSKRADISVLTWTICHGNPRLASDHSKFLS